MKKILLFLLFFVNIQIVYNCGSWNLDMSSTAFAQRMNRENGDSSDDNDDNGGGSSSSSDDDDNGGQNNDGGGDDDPEPIICIYCWQEFNSDYELYVHEQTCPEKPGNETPPTYGCQYCGQTFHSSESLDNHVKHCERNPNRLRNQFVCDRCDQRFDEQWQLDCHSTRCNPTYRCTKCKAVFYRKREYDDHVAGRLPNPCPYAW